MAEQLTPMMQQYFEIKNNHKDKIVFFRLGDFYEMFFDDALIASRVLDITLTGRDCGMKERAPMCGIPYHAADSYIAKLIENNYKVAICEQAEDPALAKGIVKREIVKIITPGTVTSSIMLDENVNNYILSVVFLEDHIGLSYLDLSTGEYFCTFTEGKEKDLILSEINRINPSELIANDFADEFSNITENVSQLDKKYYSHRESTERIKKQFNVESLESLGLENKALILACGSMLFYLDEMQKSALKNITKIKFYNITNYMIIDRNTRRNLEISETIRGRSKKGALLSVLDKTSTSMGARRLRQWVDKPLINTDEIKNRLSAVEELFDNFLFREEIKEYLKTIQDIERLSSRIALETANARDLVAFKNSIINLPHIKSVLKNFSCIELKKIYENFDVLDDLYKLIDDSISDNPPFGLKEGNLIKKGYSKEIDKFMEVSKDGKKWIMALEQTEREKTGIKTLKVGYNKVFGYYIEITKSNIQNAPDYYIRKQTLVNAERYITPELKELEETVLNAGEKLIELEYELFVKIREDIAEHIDRIQNTALLLSELDCFSSFATIAQSNNYIKPQVGDYKDIEIREGRHPVVEKLDSNNTFISNDSVIDSKDNRFLIITGPNMAGKSTYMRQTALIVLMSQIGSFVPASYAKIGVVDRIFTRVGAADDLTSGQSTFMVEMTELANITNSATKNSLITLDEIGRGTSTFDGLS
ncbi:MAG: DNA mismatch repair protein MutS, partial [Clostridiales bacterium]|nr:DNA mismatch repair protein MutS [Clostridiales bacterium]